MFGVDDTTYMAGTNGWVMRVPKALRNACVGVWARCGAWSAAALRDGFVPEEIVKGIGSAREISALVVAESFSVVEDGYQIADWEPCNKLRERVLADREATRNRVRNYRSNGGSNAVTNGGGNAPPREGHGKSFSRAEPPNLQTVAAVDPDDVPAYLAVLRGGNG